MATTPVDITTMAMVVATVLGADHCHPIVSWLQMARPTPRKTRTEQPNAASDRRPCSTGLSGRPAIPAAASRANRPLRATSRPRLSERGRSMNSSTSSSANSAP